MKFSYKWLKEYFEEPLPEIKDLVEILTFHSFEVEGVEDNLIDIDVLPNRSHDCFCYQGIAREISVLTSLKLREEDKKEIFEKNLKSSDHISLSVKDTNLVFRATKRLVQNVKIGQSPDWLREKLESIGQKSINNVVDITNYVMWETGQPVHAFDFDKVAGDGLKEISIRNAKNGEKINTLDGGEYELDENILVISDSEKALDIAGVKGGLASGIDENTQNIILSVCNFNQGNIRETSKRLGLRTDASVRFENGISPEKVEEAMNRLSELVVDLTGGKTSEDILDVYPRKANLYKVGISTQEVNRLLGVDLLDDDIENILNKLDFKFEIINPIEKVLELAMSLENKPYKYGASVSYDSPESFDCSSFTAYLFAQAGIAIPRISVDQYFWGEEISENDLQAGDLVFSNTKDGKIYYETLDFLKGSKVEEGVDHVGVYLGGGKIIHSSRKNGGPGKVKIEELKGAVQFKNIIGYRRISNNHERFVIEIPHERLDLRIKEDLVEEIGRIYGYRNIESKFVSRVFEPKINKTFYYINKIKDILVDEGFSEVSTYTFGDKGVVEVQKPLASNLGFLRINLKDGLEKSLDLNEKNAPVLGLDEIKIFEIGKVFPSIDGEYNVLAIGARVVKKDKQSDSVRDEIIQNIITILNKELDLVPGLLSDPSSKDGQGGVFEVNLDEMIEKLPEPKSYGDVFMNKPNLGINVHNDINVEGVVEVSKFKSISAYPFMLRDIAVFVPNEFDEDDLLKIIKENAGDLLVQTKLFDTYSPEEENKTSYAFNLVFQSQEKTLTDEEINKVMDKITAEIELKGWEVR
ncbi:MAG: C40 family peptidase [Candidatus Pacebacteria bacterium]|nr:C40 family peptidase [Candidatus Paceibacterota bacterium]